MEQALLLPDTLHIGEKCSKASRAIRLCHRDFRRKPNPIHGRLALITDETIGRFARPLICSNFCKAISLKNSNYFFNFAYLWKSAYDSKVLFGWEGKTSGIKNLLFDAFTTKHLVSRPPQELAKRFFDLNAPMEAKKQKLLQETAGLAALRDWLLPMLMNGQVTVA
ncbi:MAG: hypothetical protein IPN40_14615 [Uliginosibacterium sp.]|nr:hypothetical protein [Uliginosibacterium sp.]